MCTSSTVRKIALRTYHAGQGVEYNLPATIYRVCHASGKPSSGKQVPNGSMIKRAVTIQKIVYYVVTVIGHIKLCAHLSASSTDAIHTGRNIKCRLRMFYACLHSMTWMCRLTPASLTRRAIAPCTTLMASRTTAARRTPDRYFAVLVPQGAVTIRWLCAISSLVCPGWRLTVSLVGIRIHTVILSRR
jgi:hypothetical protein